MKVLALEREIPDKTNKDFEPHLKDEALAVLKLQSDDIIREIYFRADNSEAVLVLEVNDTDEAKEVLNKLPLVKNGLIKFDIIPLKPYPGFNRLIINS